MESNVVCTTGMFARSIHTVANGRYLRWLALQPFQSIVLVLLPFSRIAPLKTPGKGNKRRLILDFGSMNGFNTYPILDI
jgi:hypothetical protein